MPHRLAWRAAFAKLYRPGGGAGRGGATVRPVKKPVAGVPVLAVDFFTGFLNAEMRGKPPSVSADVGGKENGRLLYSPPSIIERLK
jgi:hypothetical protein